MELLPRARQLLGLLASGLLLFQDGVNAPGPHSVSGDFHNATAKDVFIDNLLEQMTISDLVLQLHLMFGDNIVGPESNNELYDYAMRFSPASPVGHIHDWYPMNTSKYNDVQQLILGNAHLSVPFMHFGECLHGVGSYNQSVFPQNLGMAATFDTDIVYRTARAIGTEARSIGIHACFAPVLDLAQEPRWGRAQENFGEDKVLTSHMGVAYSSGLSKNSTWSDPDAVVPVMKHFAVHGSPESGHNTAPPMIHGNRQVLSEYLMPFKAVVQLGGVRGVMMAYSEIDDVPSPVSPMLYQALKSWGYDGFVIADDTGMQEIETIHRVAGSPADAIGQWFNAGGMIQFYDYPLGTFLNATKGLVANGTVNLDTIKTHVRSILGVKWDLGLFSDPFIAPEIDPFVLVDQHTDIALEAARKSIVLLENRNGTLPLSTSDLQKIALIGPFADIFNFGDYSGPWGQYPVHHASTIRQSILNYLKQNNSTTQLVSSWGSNSWQYNNQYAIPPYHLSYKGSPGGLHATYFANMNFTSSLLQKVETPALDWGLYPPPGLPSNNFSVIWEGELNPAVDREVNGWLGVAISANSSVRLLIDDFVVYDNEFTSVSTIITNIEPFTYIRSNSTLPPPDSVPFTFQPNVTHKIRIEVATQNTYQKEKNVDSLNAQVILFWNLVDSAGAIDQAKNVAADADVIILAVGDAWNSDGENADKGTLDLAPDQRALAEAMFSLEKPVILVLQGARPFAIPDLYNRSAAVLSTYFPGQAAGQATADVLFGAYNPGGRLPMTIPRHVGQLPVYYNYKPTAHVVDYVDIDSTPCYSFGYGLSYSSFDVTDFSATGNGTFISGDTISFRASITNNGTFEGSYVLQVYLLQRYSQIVQPVKQLMAFTRVYLQPGARTEAILELDVDRYLPILNRQYEWVLEKGAYTFALLDNGGMDADTSVNVSLQHA